MKNFNSPKKLAFARTLLLGWILSTYNILFMLSESAGQSGEKGITAAKDEIKGYFDDGVLLMYAIGAVVGIIGAIKVFNKWNAGEQDTNKVAAAWFGSCVFLVIVATVLEGFFGV